MILKFPSDKNVKDDLEDQMILLDKLYDELNAHHVMLNDLEMNANQVEQNYNKLLAKYARMVGIENIPVGFLQYSTEARIYLGENGKFEVSFDEEEEEGEPE